MLETLIHTAVVDSLVLLAGSHTLDSSAEDSTMLLWDLAGTALPQAHAAPGAAASSQTTAVAASPNGRYVVSGDDNGGVTLRRWLHRGRGAQVRRSVRTRI